MATYNLRRFAQPAVLKAIAPKRLQEFLGPYRTYFNGRGLPLPSPNASNGLDHEQLVEVLMSPDADTPKDLVDALFFVNEMSTAKCMDLLLEEAETKGLSLDGKPDPTAADVAVQVFLKDRRLLERKHAEQYLTRPRSFEYFHTKARPVPAFKQPSRETLTALEHDLDEWFEEKKRGRESRVFVYPKGDSIWFLVRHGDPFRREGSLDGGQTSSVFYRPEKHDVLVYEPALGELRMNACNNGEKETYRRKFGRYPLRRRGLLSRHWQVHARAAPDGGNRIHRLHRYRWHRPGAAQGNPIPVARRRVGDRNPQGERHLRCPRGKWPQHAVQSTHHSSELSGQVHRCEESSHRDHPALKHRPVHQGQRRRRRGGLAHQAWLHRTG